MFVFKNSRKTEVEMFIFVSFATMLIFASLASGASTEENVTVGGALDPNDCKIKLIFAHVYEDSPLLKSEKAAWITVNTQREFGFVDWPNTPQHRTQIWDAVLPDNIIAIAHTHPNHTNPKPSRQDRLVAEQRNISVYTLTRKAIWSVRPDGKTIQHVDRPWYKDYKEKCETN